MRVLCQSYDVNCNFNGNFLCKKLTNFAAKYLIVTITCKMQFPDTRGAEIIVFYFNAVVLVHIYWYLLNSVRLVDLVTDRFRQAFLGC